MRTLRIAAVGLSLLLGLCTLVYADPPDQPAKPGNGWSPFWPPNWFAAKPAPKAEALPTAARVDEGAKAAAAMRWIREQEQNAYLRRQAVCDKLQKIAEDTGDEALRRKAEVLADRAYALYLQRTSGGPDSGAASAPGVTETRSGTGQANVRRDY
jgi:hypothetical protein